MPASIVLNAVAVGAEISPIASTSVCLNDGRDSDSVFGFPGCFALAGFICVSASFTRPPRPEQADGPVCPAGDLTF